MNREDIRKVTITQIEIAYLRASTDQNCAAELVLGTPSALAAYKLRPSQLIQIARDSSELAFKALAERLTK